MAKNMVYRLGRFESWTGGGSNGFGMFLCDDGTRVVLRPKDRCQPVIGEGYQFTGFGAGMYPQAKNLPYPWSPKCGERGVIGSAKQRRHRGGLDSYTWAIVDPFTTLTPPVYIRVSVELVVPVRVVGHGTQMQLVVFPLPMGEGVAAEISARFPRDADRSLLRDMGFLDFAGRSVVEAKVLVELKQKDGSWAKVAEPADPRPRERDKYQQPTMSGRKKEHDPRSRDDRVPSEFGFGFITP